MTCTGPYPLTVGLGFSKCRVVDAAHHPHYLFDALELHNGQSKRMESQQAKKLALVQTSAAGNFVEVSLQHLLGRLVADNPTRPKYS